MEHVSVTSHRRAEVYWPKQRPGFVAWAAAFDYGGGRVGLAFKEIIRQDNPGYRPLALEYGEGLGVPVSYASAEGGGPKHVAYQVYMASDDEGETFYETGRNRIEDNCFCHMGFEDGSIIHVTTPAYSEDRKGIGTGLVVEHSSDGGSTFQPLTTLLKGTAPYLWRMRKLSDGTVLLLTCLYGTPWGQGRPRVTRNTILPGESYIAKTIPCFLATEDQGKTWTGPHYILPGTGAHEYDVVELPDDELLFIAGDVQATPVARQTVKRVDGRYINGTLYGIGKGAPEDPQRDAQGGYVPESVVRLSDGLLVGSRRNQLYTYSADNGENWFQIPNLPKSLYQPWLLALPSGKIINFFHKGGDSAFGQHDMYMGADIFTLENHLPGQPSLTLRRCLTPDGNQYSHCFTAQLCCGGAPLEGRELSFFSSPAWRSDGSSNTDGRDKAKYIKRARTNAEGEATVCFDEYAAYGDIHHYYTVEVAYLPPEGALELPCDGPRMNAGALTPRRGCPYPYDAYFAEGVLYLSPQGAQRCPELLHKLQQWDSDGYEIPEGYFTEQEEAFLLEWHVAQKTEEGLRWIPSVHAHRPLAGAQMMAEGDEYV